MLSSSHPNMVTEKCVNELLPIITKIANLSFINGKFPDAVKSALKTPLIKKPKLDCEILKNYGSVANLSFLGQRNLANNNLRGKIQSAYKLYSWQVALIVKKLRTFFLLQAGTYVISSPYIIRFHIRGGAKNKSNFFFFILGPKKSICGQKFTFLKVGIFHISTWCLIQYLEVWLHLKFNFAQSDRIRMQKT